MPRARYRYIVEGQSPRDGVWVRNVGYFKKISDAKNYIRLFMPLILLAGGYTMMRVQKIIVFNPLVAAECCRKRSRRIRLMD